MWFHDSDPVSIHTLVYAAYEILCAICKKRGQVGDHIIYDSERIKPEYQQLWNSKMREHGNFFKHADRDPEAVIEFTPSFTELFMVFSVTALHQCGEETSVETEAFNLWIVIHYPEFLTPEFQAMIQERVPIQNLREMKRVGKAEFFETFQQARILVGRNRM